MYSYLLVLQINRVSSSVGASDMVRVPQLTCLELQPLQNACYMQYNSLLGEDVVAMTFSYALHCVLSLASSAIGVSCISVPHV